MTGNRQDQQPPTAAELAQFEMLCHTANVDDSVNALHQAALRAEALQAYESAQAVNNTCLISHSQTNSRVPSWSQGVSVIASLTVCILAMLVLWTRQREMTSHDFNVNDLTVLEVLEPTAYEHLLASLQTVNQFANESSTPEYFQALELCELEFRQELNDFD